MNEVKEKKLKLKPIEIDNDGNIVIKNESDLISATNRCLNMSMAPDSLKETPGGVAAALLMCKQFNLPQKSMSNMAFINGKLTVFSDLYTAIAKRSPEFGDVKVQFYDENSEIICAESKNLAQEEFGCLISVKKKGSDVWNEYNFNLNHARKAGLYFDKPNEKQAKKPWQKYTMDMLYHKAKSRAFGREFADYLEGVHMYEDFSESKFDTRVVSPNSSKDRMNLLSDALKTEEDGKEENDSVLIV